MTFLIVFGLLQFINILRAIQRIRKREVLCKKVRDAYNISLFMEEKGFKNFPSPLKAALDELDAHDNELNVSTWIQLK